MRVLGVLFSSFVATAALLAQSLTVSPSSLNFQNELVGAASEVHSAAISNSGSSAVSLGGISTNGDFTETSTCPLSADDFNRATGSLGPNWARADAGLGGGFSIQNDQAADAGFSSLTASRWVGTTNPADQFSQATIVAVAASGRVAVTVRSTNSAFTNYAGGINSYDFSGNGYRIWKAVNGTKTSLAYTSTQTMHAVATLCDLKCKAQI